LKNGWSNEITKQHEEPKRVREDWWKKRKKRERESTGTGCRTQDTISMPKGRAKAAGGVRRGRRKGSATFWGLVSAKCWRRGAEHFKTGEESIVTDWGEWSEIAFLIVATEPKGIGHSKETFERTSVAIDMGIRLQVTRQEEGGE